MSKVDNLNFHIKSALIDLAVRLIARFTHLDRLDIWAVLDEYGRDHNVKLLQDIVQKSPDILAKRIERDLDSAIIDYNGKVFTEEVPDPVWIDEAEGDTKLGGTLGFSYDFVVDLDENEED